MNEIKDESKEEACLEKIIESNIKSSFKRSLWPKWLTLPRVLLWGFFVFIPGVGISVAYLAKGVSAVENSINEKIDKRVVKISDSVNSCTQTKINKLMMSSAKTNSYLEVIMNEETRNVAESKWRRDSTMITNNKF